MDNDEAFPDFNLADALSYPIIIEFPEFKDLTDNKLFAPDVIEYKGKYYLFAYIIGAKGCVAVSERPEGPFELIAPYDYINRNNCFGDGWFIDPGVFADDDGQIYITADLKVHLPQKSIPRK